MIRRRRPARSGRRLRLGVALLSCMALALMAAWVILFIRLMEADRSLDARVREDALWAVFQADRHAQSLVHRARLALALGTPGLHDDLVEAYEILYSRAVLLERGAFRIDLQGETDIAQLAATVSADILALAEHVDALDPAGAGYADALGALLPQFVEVSGKVSDLLLRTNYAMNELRVAERAARHHIHDRLGWSGALLVVAFIGIGTLLALQLVHLRHAHRRMGLLRQISHRQAVRARAASRAKSTFLATMSHEIRTPLNGIIASAELLGVSEMSQMQAQRVMTIRTSGQLLLDVIDDILDFSKLESRGVEARAAPVDLPEVAELIRAAFADRAAAKRIDFIVALPPARVEVDAARLRQVIANLLGNALKFTQAGHVHLIGTLRGTDRLRVEVVDTGIGIAAADQAQIFEEFRQADGSYTRDFGGSGLGLAIVRRIVEGMSGSIGVESAPGLGSTFWFELPVRVLGPSARPEPPPAAPPAEAPPPEVRAAPAPNRRPAAAPGGLRVLLVEDNAVNREVMIDLLAHLGHATEIAVNGLEAVGKVAEGAHDLILMDMQMPVLSGPDAARRIRAAGCRLPIIGVTANASAEDRELCRTSGMDGFLSKPVTLARLREALAELRPAPAAPPAGIATLRQAPGPTSDRSPAPAVSRQLAELDAMLGPAKVAALLARFEASLPEVEQKLAEAVARGDAAAADAELHTIKGAAMTIGLDAAGRFAQALRAPDACGPEAVADLMFRIRDDLAAARRWLDAPADAPPARSA